MRMRKCGTVSVRVWDRGHTLRSGLRLQHPTGARTGPKFRLTEFAIVITLRRTGNRAYTTHEQTRGSRPPLSDHPFIVKHPLSGKGSAK
jgi:hypothetical protein